MEDIDSSDVNEQFDKLIDAGHEEKNSRRGLRYSQDEQGQDL